MHQFLLTASMAYYAETGSVLDSIQALDALQRPAIHSVLLGQWMAFVLVLMPPFSFAVLTWTLKKDDMLQYLVSGITSLIYECTGTRLETTWDSEDDAFDDLELNKYGKYRKRRYVPFGLSHSISLHFRQLGVYLLFVLLFRTSEPWNGLSSDILLDYGWATAQKGWNILSGNDPDHALFPYMGYSPRPSPWQYPDDFKDTWRVSNFDQQSTAELPRGEFKHVFVIVLESFRSDMLPFQPEASVYSQLDHSREFDGVRMTDDGHLFTQAKVKLNGSDPHSNDVSGLPRITPFGSQLFEKSFHASMMYSTSSYTIKSLVSILCGVHPLNTNNNMEGSFKIPAACLPELLANISVSDAPRTIQREGKASSDLASDYEDIDVDQLDRDWLPVLDSKREFISGYFQASDDRFDGQRSTMKHMRFDIIAGKETITKYSHSAKDETNYLGYGDHDILPFALRFLDHGLETGKRTLTTLLTAVSHHPWSLPWSHRHMKRKYSSIESTLNDYLNTVHYTDQFLSDLFEALQRRGILKESLIVITGDHGLTLGEHNKWGCLQTPYEECFRVPFLMYSGHAAFPRQTNVKGVWSHVDILPTIMDAYLPDAQFNNIMRKSNVDGQSIFRENLQRISVSLASPGNDFLIVREGDFKAVFLGPSLLKEKTLAGMMAAAVRGQYKSQERLYHLRLDPQERKSYVSEWMQYKSGLQAQSFDLEHQLLIWFDRAREQAFHFVRRNRMRYRFHYES